ncbi:hypothetical protein [Flavobacterium sp.]|uniref:hypothetical protein n=1 Tax=Flavobacterium sp. TaxID=239 RepID=UPI003342CBC6
MKTTNKDMVQLYEYLNKRGATLSVDRNPSPEKISRIKEAIRTKNDFFANALERFSNATGVNVNS